ncbi:MAG: hypothetical protein M3418_03850 [Gemmatimonadota bacterium]|jgi:hypothetical protein|nr:hypothetical protein [Gemmatimonadota bacterium]
MFDAEKATIETLRLQFERQVAAHQPEARTTAAEYMAALTAFVDAFNDGPGSDPGEMAHDTTGTLNRIEDHVVWAEAERHRVRTALNTIV